MQTVWITRMRLAQMLIANGHIPLRTSPNPFKPRLTAWEFEATPATATVIEDYYRSIGKPVPDSIANTIKTILYKDDQK